MSVLQAVLYLVVVPIAFYALIALAAGGSRIGRRPRYRVGQPWTFEPLWWTANPKGAQLPPVAEHLVSGGKGGARGSW